LLGDGDAFADGLVEGRHRLPNTACRQNGESGPNLGTPFANRWRKRLFVADHSLDAPEAELDAFVTDLDDLDAVDGVAHL